MSAGTDKANLSQGLKQRHMTMIAFGGVIGAGLFVGSGAVIHETGPAAVLSYLLAGGLIVLVMRMLGEMAVANPTVGSFAEYARDSIGGWAGFSVGWLYWYFWVIVVGIEAIAGAGIVQHWVPGVPLWALSLGLIVLLTLTNIASVRSYGEFEFWFASIKVIAIVVFIAVATAYVLGLGSGHVLDVSNLTVGGGFAPHGVSSIFTGIAVVIFAFVGVEIVTIAAAESVEPARAVARATNSVVMRVIVFYVGSILLVETILPWNDAQVLQSPYVSVLQRVGIPAAAEIMNAIVLTAVLSCLNSGLYTASRMVFALARRGDAPGGLLHVSGRGVPLRAILLSTVVGYAAVVMAYVSPNTVFLFLVNSSGAIALFVYLLIAVSQLRMRARLERSAPERLLVRMWCYPGLTYAAIAAIVGVIASMAFIDDTRSQLVLSVASAAAVLAGYAVKLRVTGARPAAPLAAEPAAQTQAKPQAQPAHA
jgi:GABA permease